MWNDVGPEDYRGCTVNYVRELQGYNAYIRWPTEFLSNYGRLCLTTSADDVDTARQIATSFIDTALRYGPEFVRRFITTAE